MVLMQNTNTMFNTCNNYIIIIYTSQYSKLLQYIPHLYQSSITSAKGLSVSYPTASFDIRRVRNRITLLHELRGCLVSLALLDRKPPAVKIGGEDVATLRRCLSMLCTWFDITFVTLWLSHTVAYCRILSHTVAYYAYTCLHSTTAVRKE